MSTFDLNKFFYQFAYHRNEPLIFSTGLFLWLFLFFIGGFYLLRKKRDPKIIYVILFSLFFYYKSSGLYFQLLILSTVVDYTLANFIYNANTQWKKMLREYEAPPLDQGIDEALQSFMAQRKEVLPDNVS